MPERMIDSLDSALEGIVNGEYFVIVTIFAIGLGLYSLAHAMDSLSWFVKTPLYLGGMGAMLFSLRWLYAVRMGY